MLRKIRLTLAVLFFLAVTALFLDFTGTIHAWLGWTAKIQFLPALLALNVGVTVALVLLTLLFGRVYCSVICPLGVFQDIVSWISGRRKKKRYRFSCSPEKKWLRYGILGLFIVALIAGIGSFVALLAPYSSYGRIASNLFAPIYRWGNNLLAWFAERADSYAFYETEVWMKSLPTLIIAVVTFIVLAVLAWRNGRTYCNTICPVGTVLGFLSRFSLFRITIDESKCNRCGLCSRKCKAACINGREPRIDYSRCVACMDCIETCQHGAIGFRMREKAPAGQTEKNIIHQAGKNQTDHARRSFLTTTVAVATTAALKAQEKKVDGGLAVIEDKKIPVRATPVVPPGAWSARHFAQHCTGCPALRVGLSQQCAPSFGRLTETDAARNVLRTGLLPPGVYTLFRGLPCGSHPADYCRGEIVNPHRSCRMDQEKLYSADRRGGVRQLRPPLSFRSNPDGSLRQ